MTQAQINQKKVEIRERQKIIMLFPRDLIVEADKKITVLHKLYHAMGMRFLIPRSSAPANRYLTCAISNKRYYTALKNMLGPLDYEWLSKGETPFVKPKPPRGCKNIIHT